MQGCPMVLSAVEPGWWEEVEDEWCHAGIPKPNPPFWAFCTLALHWDHGDNRRVLALGYQDRAPGAGGVWMWHNWALWPGALLGSVQQHVTGASPCQPGCPVPARDLPCLLSLGRALSQCCARSRGRGSRRVGAALPWLPPVMERAQAL